MGVVGGNHRVRNACSLDHGSRNINLGMFDKVNFTHLMLLGLAEARSFAIADRKC